MPNMDQDDAIKHKEYTSIFDYDVNLVLLKGSIIRVPQADVIVNCTGKYFQHNSNFIIKFIRPLNFHFAIFAD